MIDQPDTVAAKFEHSYVPFVLNQFYKNNIENDYRHKITVSVPKKSELVKISGKSSEEHAEDYLAMLNNIIQHIRIDHERLFDIEYSKMEEQVVISRLNLIELKDSKRKELLEKGFEQQLKSIEIQLTSMADQIKLEKNKKVRFLETKVLLEKQLKDLSKGIDVSVANRSRAKTKIENSSDAMTLLLIDNEIQQYRNQMISLENRVYVDIANKILDLHRKTELQTKNLSNKKIEMQEKLENYDRSVLKKASLKRVETRFNNSKQTHTLVNPMKSIESVGLSEKLIVVLGVFAAMFLSLIAAFIHEFVVNIKNELKVNT